MSESTYEMKLKCENCGYKDEAEIPLGSPASGKVICSNCGCKEAVYIPLRYS